MAYQQKDKSGVKENGRLHYVRRILEKDTSLTVISHGPDGGLGVAAFVQIQKEQPSPVLTCHAAAMALDPLRRRTHCGYCASPVQESISCCQKCTMISMCDACQKQLEEWHTSSGECLVLQALVNVVGLESLDACLLLTMRLLWRQYHDSQISNRKSTDKDNSPPLPPVDWKLFDCLYSSPTLAHDDDDDSISVLIQNLQQAITAISKEISVDWLTKKSWHGVMGRVLGCSHAITDVTLPLGEQCLGRALFLEHSFYNHDCMPNAFLSCLIEKGKTNVAQHVPAVTARLHVLRPIEENEPVTISYIPMSGLDKKERQSRLQEGYDFDCKCDACSRNLLQDHLKLPNDADVESLRQVQFSCNAQLLRTEKEMKEKERNDDNENDLDSCLGMLRMLKRGLENQHIPASHEVALETHRLLAKAYSLSANHASAVKERESFFKGLEPIQKILDPVAKATQHLEYARDIKALGDHQSQRQQLSLALESATLALGCDHPFVQSVAHELSALGETSKKRKCA